jgi:hypothetical protein
MGAIGQELRSGPSKESKRGGRAAARAAAAPAPRLRTCLSRRDRVDKCLFAELRKESNGNRICASVFSEQSEGYGRASSDDVSQ